MKLFAALAVDVDALDGTQRRALRLLQIGVLLLIGVCLQALVRHALFVAPAALLLQLGGLLLAAGIWWLLRRARLGLAGPLFVGGAALLVGLSSLLLDTPGDGTPRSTHLYLLPLMLLADSVLAPLRRRWRVGMQLGLLLLFLLLAGLAPFSLSLSSAGAGARAVGALLTVGLVLGLLALLIHLHDSAWLAQGELELALARAIADGRLSLALQPQCDAAGRVLGAEALVRWQDAQRGWVSPAVFVPLAERNGLVLALGEQVLAQVLALQQRWREDPRLGRLPVAVNLSALQLQDDTHLERLLARVAAADLPPGRLKFELTETVMVAEPERMRELLQRCRAQGIATALDDFGTGFASLATLGQLPFDQLKIDQRFVRQLPGNPRSQKVARTLVELGERLGLAVIAEGVETAEHVELLQAMGVRQFQGYHFAKPMTPDSFEEWCQHRPP